MKKFFLFFLVLILFYPTNVFALENFSLSDISSGDFFGHDIESIGDIDGDGISDIAVGAHKKYSPGTEMKRVGALHLI